MFFTGGTWRRSAKEAKFREHLSEQEANVNPPEECILDLTHVGGAKFPTGEPHHWVWMKGPNSVFVGVCSICHIPNFEDLRYVAADIWTEAYRAGAHDERIAPVDRRYGPHRGNPFIPFPGKKSNDS